LSDKENLRSYKGIKIDKNRNGILMREGLEFDGEHMQFVESKSDFEKFKAEVKQMEKGEGRFVSADGEETPFENGISRIVKKW
jgi:hypothetical protein